MYYFWLVRFNNNNSNDNKCIFKLKIIVIYDIL